MSQNATKPSRIHVLRAATAFSATLLAASVALAGEDVTFEQLPPAVQQTVKREVAHGNIKDIERDHEGNKVVYEVEFYRDGKKWELDVAEDGTVLKKHED